MGDVAGMSADLFGSFAESTCAALVMSSTTLIAVGNCQYEISNLMYPLMLIGLGIFFCILVSVISTHIMSVKTIDKVEQTLKLQLLISTIILLGVIYGAAALTYPNTFEVRTKGKVYGSLTTLIPYFCSICGLVSGMIIAAFTEYVTSHSYGPVR